MAPEQRRTPRRSGRTYDTPDRVSQAAESMAADRLNRGYIPNSSYPGPTPPQTPPPQAYYPPQGGPAYPGGNGYPGPAASYGAGPADPRLAQEYAARQYMAQQAAVQQAAAQQEMARQERYRREQTAERKRVSEATSTTGAFRGYTSGNRPVTAVPDEPVSPVPVRKQRSWIMLLAAVLGVAAIAVGAVMAVQKVQADHRYNEMKEAVEAYDNLFCEGVYVDGIHLGGMTPEQAQNSVESRIQQRNSAWKVQLTYQGEIRAEIDARRLGMSVDTSHVLNQAWSQGHTGTLEQRYAAMAALQATPYHGYTAAPSGDTTVIDSILETLKTSIDRPARDAVLERFDTSLAYPFVITEEETGLRLDTETVRKELYQMASTMTGGSVELQPEVLQPAVRREDLQKQFMLRSSIYTPISTASTEERNMNIQRSFDFINGYVLEPGREFSFNKVVGERTEQNGFYPAIEYAYGEHVMGVGGGVCQASTTLYQAAICAGLQVLKRSPHSDAVSYTEYGKDATVYWGSRRNIDLVFKNTSEGRIYIVAGVQKDPSNRKRQIAKVSMYGLDMGDVRYEIEAVVTEELPPPEEPQYIKDKNAEYVTYTDQQKSVSKAQVGYVVESYRVQYTGNVLSDRTFLAKDTYDPKPEKIYVGVTKRPEK